eukprot:m.24224 g.24224  ORF g.24224 m.24224 type:complete len:388 (-) comp4245_c0_seq1:1221-2384(-)
MAAPLVSVVLPVCNSAAFLGAALDSVIAQTHRPLELSVFDDASSDDSLRIVEDARSRLEASGVELVLSSSTLVAVRDGIRPRDEAVNEGICGPGYARNQCIVQSRGEFLCFLDSDDVMAPFRVELQLAAARNHPRALVGSRFERDPPEATERFNAWCNGMDEAQLLAHRFRDCTLIQPTWFIRRSLLNAAGGYDNCGWAEDLKFYYAHLGTQIATLGTAAPSACCLSPDDCGCEGCDAVLVRIDKPLVTYRYRGETSVTHKVSTELLRSLRCAALETQVFGREPWCDGFTIWGAGKNGRKFYRTLNKDTQKLVRAFVDVDPAKIEKGSVRMHDLVKFSEFRDIPVRHINELRPPFIACVSLQRTEGAFEANLDASGFTEGIDFFQFS